MRQEHRAGEKVFVDYAGQKPTLIDPRTGAVVEVELFVGVLGASNYTYGEASRTQQLPDWLASHQRMFAFFGGVSRAIVPDFVPGNKITVLCPPPLCGRGDGLAQVVRSRLVIREHNYRLEA